MASIHPTASVSAESELGADVEIGPHCVLSGRVRLADGVRLVGNVYLSGPVEVGAGTEIYPFACLGFPPQDVKFKRGDKTAGVVIGAGGRIRESVTVHAATNDHTPTRIGDRVFMMVTSHVGHDAQIGDGVVMVNGSLVAGHARIGDGVTLAGAAVVHQFCRMGRLSFMSGLSGVSTNVPPFMVAWGRNEMIGVNLVGLRRAGFSREEITEVRRAYREVFRARLRRGEMVRELEERGRTSPAVLELARFVAESNRPICPCRTPKRAGIESEADEEVAG